jgi:hypothetical protein
LNSIDDIGDMMQNSVSAESLNIRDVIRSLGIKSPVAKSEETPVTKKDIEALSKEITREITK